MGRDKGPKTAPPLVRYRDLGPDQKCVYYAFGAALHVEARGVGQWVDREIGRFANTEARFSADDGEAVLFLATSNGFAFQGAWVGQCLTESKFRTQPNCTLVCVIAQNQGALGFRAMFATNPDMPTDVSPADPLTGKQFDAVRWHAIAGTADGNGKITWTDFRQSQRRHGPYAGDLCLLFVR
jgi:hypothetical protein